MLSTLLLGQVIWENVFQRHAPDFSAAEMKWIEMRSPKSILRQGDTQAVNTSLFQWVNTVLV